MHKNTVRAAIGFTIIAIGFLIIALAPVLARAETDQSPTWPDRSSRHNNTAASALKATPAPEPKPVSASDLESACNGFQVATCLYGANCSFAIVACKQQDRECRDWKATRATASPPHGEWIQNEYWPEACYIMNGREILWESELARIVSKMRQKSGWLDLQDKNQGWSWGLHIVNGQIVTCEELQMPETPQVVPRSATTPATPDCTRLVNENHPECRP